MKTLLAPLVLALSLSACGASPDVAPDPQVASAAETCSVEGCVVRAGAMTLEGQRTVLEAIQLAGPIEGRSDLRNVRLVRSTDPAMVIRIDVQAMLESGDSSFNVLLKPGDVLHVAELPQLPERPGN
jgi:protein involved in polysaccharide export with SLBB domain